jgi:uncharacterized protein (TIGR00290 family)
MSTSDQYGPTFCSFSGGKDSCLALWRVRQQGVDVKAVLAMLDETGERNRSHGVPLALLEHQARALGVELVTRSATWQTYETAFVDACSEFSRRGFTHAVFGDIDLVPHREWEERVCARAGIRPLLPLWQGNRLALCREFLDAGFRAVVVCVDSRFLSDEFCGLEYNDEFLSNLPAGVDACGENGEFHTFVFDGPMFSAPVALNVSGTRVYVSPPAFGSQRYVFAELRAA